jgi:hypothetical protein
VTFGDYGNEKEGLGTGFFLKTPDSKVHLVSNRHVFDAGYSDPRKKGWVLKRIKIAGYCEGTFEPFLIWFSPKNLLAPKNEFEDVASVDVSIVDIDGHLPSHVTSLNFAYFAKSKDYPAVSISDIVAFPVYHGSSLQPVMRTGWIASDPNTDFRNV